MNEQVTDINNNDPRENLHRLFDEDAEFIIGDPTEIHRPQAKKTEYVGKVGKDKELGFWMLALVSPYKGRAIPFNLITYFSQGNMDFQSDLVEFL